MDNGARPRVRPDLALVEIDDDAIVYDPRGNELHFLSGSAATVFQLCDGTATAEQTAAEIAEAYGAPVSVVEPDVRATVDEFGRQGLLEGVVGEAERNRLAESELPQSLSPDERRRIRMQVPTST